MESAVNGQSSASKVLDPFDPSNYRKPQDPRLNPDANQTLSGLPAVIEPRKPKKSWFFRVHPDPDYRAELPLFTDEDSKRRREGNTYLFTPGLEIPPDLEGLVRPTLVAAAITSTGVPFLYTLAVYESTWYDSGLEVVSRALAEWIRVHPGDGCYVVHASVATLPDPVFPTALFREWLERAFSKRLITSLDHPVIHALRGVA